MEDQETTQSNVPRRAVFLDRDDTINRDTGYLADPDGVEILPGVIEGLIQIRELGYVLVIITNQSGIGRGYFTEDDFRKVQSRIVRDLGIHGIEFLDTFHCPFHPEAAVTEYRLVSEDRKPAPGMLFKAAAKHDLALEQSFMIGNAESDVIAGQRAGCRSIRLCEKSEETVADFIAADLVESAAIIREFH